MEPQKELCFNTTGPCRPEEHYMLPPERRLGEVMSHIEARRYFTLHAGRQTGKTTSAKWLEQHLNASGRFHAVWVDLETARGAPDTRDAMSTILRNAGIAIQHRTPMLNRPDDAAISALLDDPKNALRLYLMEIARRNPLPIVVFFDEADCLVGDAMLSFLTQLRQGYLERDKVPFPSSIALVGLRQVRDYVLEEGDRSAVRWLGTSSPFNVTAEAATLAPFEESEVGELLSQHTGATGQAFTREAVRRVWELGRGHPWLTNALADQIVRRDVKDRSTPITAEHVEAAKETIILERRSHIDSLVAKLREPRVRRVIEPMLLGERAFHDALNDDLSYVLGLGLLRMERGRYVIANPIYQEVIPRALAFDQQAQIANEPAWYVRKDGSLDVEKLMIDWQSFWRVDGHLAAGGFGYKEAGPHLMFMAFLQRIVNGGGQILREYALGRGAIDLLVSWKGERHAIEMKIRRDRETEKRAVAQLSGYLDRLGLSLGWLLMFDPRKGMSWGKKLTMRKKKAGGKIIRIVGC